MNTTVFSFLRSVVSDAKARSGLASFGFSVAESALGSTHVGKMFKELESAAKKDAARRGGGGAGEELK